MAVKILQLSEWSGALQCDTEHYTTPEDIFSGILLMITIQKHTLRVSRELTHSTLINQGLLWLKGKHRADKKEGGYMSHTLLDLSLTNDEGTLRSFDANILNHPSS